MSQDRAEKNASSTTRADLVGTKLEIAEAALETLKTKGYSGSSAREIARTGDFNQALIFYHFGSVRNLLLAALDLTSDRRMQAYGQVFEQAQTLPELAQLVKRTYAEDLEHGYITVLGEMVAAGVTDAELGPAVVARMQPWIDMVEHKVTDLLTDSPFKAMVPARDLAFGLVSLYLGIDMLSHLEGNQSRAKSLLEHGIRLSAVAGAFLPAKQPEESS